MSESKWNGEFIPPVGVECWISWRFKPPVKAKFTYVGKGVLCYETDGGEFSTSIDQIDFCSPVETPQQREKRENLELAYELYSFLCESKNNQPKNFENFKSVNHGLDAAAWVELVKLTNYRETKNGKK